MQISGPPRRAARIGLLLPSLLALAIAACTRAPAFDGTAPTSLEGGSALNIATEFVPVEGTAMDIDNPFSFEGVHVYIPDIENADSVNGFLASLVPGDVAGAVSSRLNFPIGEQVVSPHLTSDASQGWVTANDEVVSLLAPAMFTMPEGDQYDYWIAATIIPESTNEVLIEDLFASTNLLEPAVREAIISSGNSCFTDALDGDSVYTSAFVLLEEGIRFGFEEDAIAPSDCGALSVLVPWKSIDPHLNNFGQRLRDAIAE